MQKSPLLPAVCNKILSTLMTLHLKTYILILCIRVFYLHVYLGTMYGFGAAKLGGQKGAMETLKLEL